MSQWASGHLISNAGSDPTTQSSTKYGRHETELSMMHADGVGQGSIAELAGSLARFNQ